MNEDGLRVFFSCRPKNRLSRIMADLQDGVSHTGFRFFMFKTWLWEAKGHGGLSYSDHIDFEKNVVIVEEYLIKWTNEEKMECLLYMDTLLRNSYGFFGVLGMIAVLICKKLGGWTDNPFPWGFFCSQAVYKILKDVFRFYVDGDPSESRVGPDDLRDMFRELSIKYPDKIVRLK